MLSVPRRTFSRWYDRYRLGGDQALKDKAPMPTHVWNRNPDGIRDKLVGLALERPELSPRELAVTFTDTQHYFVSESSVYRLLKAHAQLDFENRLIDLNPHGHVQTNKIRPV